MRGVSSPLTLTERSSLSCMSPILIHPHTNRPPVGFNAAEGLFYVNPWVVVVTDEDRRDPEYFFAMLELRYAFVMPLHVSCRLLVVDPRVMHMRMLGEAVAARCPPKRKRAHRHRAGKRHKGQQAGVAAGMALLKSEVVSRPVSQSASLQ